MTDLAMAQAHATCAKQISWALNDEDRDLSPESVKQLRKSLDIHREAARGVDA